MTNEIRAVVEAAKEMGEALKASGHLSEQHSDLMDSLAHPAVQRFLAGEGVGHCEGCVGDPNRLPHLATVPCPGLPGGAHPRPLSKADIATLRAAVVEAVDDLRQGLGGCMVYVGLADSPDVVIELGALPAPPDLGPLREALARYDRAASQVNEWCDRNPRGEVPSRLNGEAHSERWNTLEAVRDLLAANPSGEGE